MFGAPEPGDAIVAITDGEDHRSANYFKKVERALLAAGVRSIPVVVYSIDRQEWNAANAEI